MPRGIPNYTREQATKDFESSTARIARLRAVIADAYIEMAAEASKLTKALAKLSGIGP